MLRKEKKKKISKPEPGAKEFLSRLGCQWFLNSAKTARNGGLWGEALEGELRFMICLALLEKLGFKLSQANFYFSLGNLNWRILWISKFLYRCRCSEGIDMIRNKFAYSCPKVQHLTLGDRENKPRNKKWILPPKPQEKWTLSISNDKRILKLVKFYEINSKSTVKIC